MTKFISGLTPPLKSIQNPLTLVFCANKLLVYTEKEGEILPRFDNISEFGWVPIRQHYLGQLDEQPCFSVEVNKDSLAPSAMAFQNLWQVFTRLDTELSGLVSCAFQIINWDRSYQFCSQCAEKTETMTTERAKKCPKCGLQVYPPISPSIIVLISNGDKLLLARGHKWGPNLFSVIAGFVEPGESLEEAVKREVREEVGLEVKNISYFGSQSWPFPHSLMLGFTADYASGQITVAPNELETANWFSIDNLPTIPPKMSIARQLIDAFVNK